MRPALILMYHDIIPTGYDKSSSGFNVPGADAYKISTETFEDQVAYAEKLKAETDQEIIFTFDDGGISASTIAAPILEKHGFRGFFFIPTAYIGKPGFLSENDISLLHSRGHVIGSHGHDHKPKMNKQPFGDILKEWQQSITILNKIIPEPIRYASVPGGWYSPIVARAAVEAGLTDLYTSEPTLRAVSISNTNIYGRFAIRENMDMDVFKNMVSGNGLVRQKMWIRWLGGQILKKL